MTKILDILKSLLLLILIPPLLGACSRSDEDVADFEEGIPTEVKFTLSSLFNAAGTRADADADGTPVDPVCDNEKIRDWFMVFVDKTGKVAKILNRSDAETGIAVSQTDAFEQEKFRCVLPSGTYSVFAFANMTQSELKEHSDIEFTQGNTLTTEEISNIKKGISRIPLNDHNINEKAIPMTGYVSEIKVRNTIDETFAIEVIRMAAKVQLIFSNPTDKGMTVTEVSFYPVTTSPVALFPNGNDEIDYGHLGDHAYTPIDDAKYGTLTLTSSVTVESGASGVSYPFYMKESLSDSDNDQAFRLGLKIRHDNGTVDRQQYNITQDIKKYINRNDWIVIPITLSQYDVWVEALFYPPIGGYPAVLSTTHPDGSQIFTFGTEGDFSIVPHVIDKFTDTHLAPAKYSIQIGEPTGDVEIFTKTPTVTPTATSLPDEITGTLSNETGTAKVEVTVTIGTKIYTRNIYIIRE